MKPETNIEKFIRRIEVIPDAERKRLGLEKLLEARDKSKKSTSADVPPTIRRFTMNRQIWKVAAALLVAATVIGVIGILQNGGQAAYAFQQTMMAMKGKCSFHVQTYWGKPTQRKDEFWAEFDEHGQVIRCRQLEWWGQDDRPIEVIWENRLKHQYEPFETGGPGTLLISKIKHHVDKDKLEDFDPEILMERIYNKIDDGEATVDVGESPSEDGYVVIEVKEHKNEWLKVFLVDPVTDFVVRMDRYEPYEPQDPDDEDYDDESLVVGDYKYIFGIEVLEYNQPFKSRLFQPNFPADTIVIDQRFKEVGMDQGDFSDEEVAYEVLRQALDAWAADDYDTAGMLFGGAPCDFFMHRTFKKPIDDIVIEEPVSAAIESGRPRFKFKCRYVTEREGRLITTNEYYFVTTVANQPGRWFVTPIKL